MPSLKPKQTSSVQSHDYRYIRGFHIALQTLHHLSQDVPQVMLSRLIRTHLKVGCALQEAWQPMFDSVATTQDCTRIATGVLSTIRINPERMLAGLSADMLATDLAEYLVRKGECPELTLPELTEVPLYCSICIFH